MGPFSLAVDWITENIYLVEKSSARIDVFSSNGQNRSNLMTSNLYAPNSIVLDPADGLLFIVDSGNPSSKLQAPKIERAFMDGSGRQIIIKDKLLEPVAITLDAIKKRIFWIDRKYDHLETSDYYGSKRRIINSGSRYLPHSISLDVFESSIFYADTTKLAIMKFIRHTINTDVNVTYHYKLNSNLPKSVKIFHQTKQLKERQNPCQNNNAGCEHFCLLGPASSTGNSFRCKCKLGYQLKRDLKTCQRVQESLFISQTRLLRGISLDQNIDTETRTPILAEKIGAIRAIEVDCRNNITFYYDPIRRAIFQNKYNGEETRDASVSSVLIPNDLSYVENMAWDWIGKNLYFTNNGKISVVQYSNPKNRREIIKQTQVYGLAIDPNAGYLFFSTINRPAKISRAYLDGTNVTVLQQRGLSLPYSVTIDYQSKKVYWADSHLSKIQYCDYNGNNLNTLIGSSISSPISIVVYKYNLYFYDLRLSTIYKSSKFFANSPTILRSNVNNIYQMKIFSYESQSSIDNHPCSRQNGDCSHFCFAVPSLTSQYQLLRHCGNILF